MTNGKRRIRFIRDLHYNLTTIPLRLCITACLGSEKFYLIYSMDKWLTKTSATRTDACIATTPIVKKRKYDDSYLQFGFTVSQDLELPFCLLCKKSLSNSSMLPTKLNRHLETTHPEFVGKPKSYFESMQAQQIKQTKKMGTFFEVPEKATLASFKIAQLLCKKKKPHTDAESILAPAFSIVAGIMLGPDAELQLKKVPLSNDTISRRIKSMSIDIDSQVKEAFSVADNTSRSSGHCKLMNQRISVQKLS